jgi:hypothetical protein
MAHSLYISACHESRFIDLIDKRHELWSQVAKLFDELCTPWTDIRTDDQQIQWLLARLRHYRDLALDRVSIYEVTTSQRLRHAKIRGDSLVEYSFEHRHGIEPNGLSADSSGPAHVYSIGRL